MNQNSTNTQTVQESVQHSKPIPISTQHLRHRSTSFSSESSNSPTSSPPLVTPNFPATRNIPTSASSPILYFLSQSPSKAPSTFPFRGFAPPVIEDELVNEHSSPTQPLHAGTITTGRFQPQPTLPEPHHERGVNILRRLSLGNHLGKPHAMDLPQPSNPQPPPNSAVSSSSITNNIPFDRKPRRSATITGQTRPRRAPSPMGERILKGHFDGFN